MRWESERKEDSNNKIVRSTRREKLEELRRSRFLGADGMESLEGEGNEEEEMQTADRLDEREKGHVAL